MYGWDSYFIQVGLLADGETEKRATWSRTSVRDRALRDHPQREPDVLHDALAAALPHEMILGVFEKTGDKEWLAAPGPRSRLLPVLDDGAAPRSRDGALALLRPRRRPRGGGAERREGCAGPHALRAIREHYRDHPDAAKGDYDIDRYYDRKNDRLTDLF